MSPRSRIVLVLLVFAACGPTSHGTGGDGGPPGGDGALPGDGSIIPPVDAAIPLIHDLVVTPATAQLTVTGGVAAHQAYVVKDGSGQDVTSQATLTLSQPDMGTFAGADLTTATDHGGHATVTAVVNGHDGTSDLKVHLTQTIVDPSLPAGIATTFGTATAGGAAPTLVYPDTGLLVQANLGTLEFHFKPAAGQNAFEITFTGSLLDLTLYVPCTPLGAGCVWSPSPAMWSVLGTAGRGDQPLSYTLRGLDKNAAHPVVGASAPRTIQFSTDDVKGGLYYWAATPGQVMRYDFGLAGQTAEKYLAVNQTAGVVCVGCHSLSRDGGRIAVGLDIPGPASVQAFDVATRAPQWTGAGFPGSAGANFFSFSPDNARLVSSAGANLEVRSAIDGSGMTTQVQAATMPDWSPDGAHVVFARPAQPLFIPVGNPGVAQGSIVEVDTASWHQEKVLVQSAGATENNYYPAYAPDGNWVVFNRTANKDSYDQPDAKVYLVARSGGPAIRLATASPVGGDSWPKWSPLAHTYASGTVFWLTFSSRRAYGLRGGTNAQLWMVGIDTARVAAGKDPSFAAFWLPFQDPGSGNHIAQWVEKIDRQPCDPAPCLTGEFCSQGVCLPNPN
jgi:TolB protein